MVWILEGAISFSPLIKVRPGSGVHATACLTDTAGKMSGREVDNSSISSAEVKNEWRYSSTHLHSYTSPIINTLTTHSTTWARIVNILQVGRSKVWILVRDNKLFSFHKGPARLWGPPSFLFDRYGRKNVGDVKLIIHLYLVPRLIMSGDLYAPLRLRDIYRGSSYFLSCMHRIVI
jgi:hypothetical protein